MNITEVRISLNEAADDQLLAFCSITFDRAFVIRDVKIISGPNGPFVAMPSRRATFNCERCRCKIPYGSKYCSECGTKVSAITANLGSERNRNYIDIAHPINSQTRESIERHVLAAYQQELAHSANRTSPKSSQSAGQQQPSSESHSQRGPHWDAEASVRENLD